MQGARSSHLSGGKLQRMLCQHRLLRSTKQVIDSLFYVVGHQVCDRLIYFFLTGGIGWQRRGLEGS